MLDVEARIRVDVGSTTPQEADAGGFVSAAFVVTNLADGASVVRTEVELPPGWRLLTPDSSVVLERGGTETRIIGVAVPSTAAAGTYHIHYTAYPEAAPAERVRTSIPVYIRERHRLQMSRTGAPQFVIAGTSYVAEFRLMNRGNAASTVRLTLQSDHEIAARVDSLSVRMEAGESRIVPVEVETRAGMHAAVQHRVTLRADIVRAGADSVATASATSVVTVVPRTGASGARFHELPMELQLSTVGSSSIGMGAGISGSGALWDGSSIGIDVSLRGPQPTTSLLGGRDEYRVGVRSRDFAAAVGDQLFQLSPLTEMGRYASGLEASARHGEWSLGGFTNRDRWSHSGTEQQAVYVDYHGSEQWRVGAHYLAQGGPEAGRLWSVRGRGTPIPGANFDVEFGRGSGERGTGNAFAFMLSGHRPGISYTVRRVHTDAAFPTRGGATDHQSARVSWNPWKKLQLEADLRGHEVSRTRDSARSFFNVQRSVDLYVGYAGLGRVGFRGGERRSELLGTPFDAQTQSVELDVGFMRGRTHLSATTELGTTVDRRTGRRDPVLRYALRAGTGVGSSQSYSMHLERFVGRTYQSWRPEARLSGGANAAYRLGERSQASLMLYGSVRENAGTPSRHGMLMAQMQHRLRNSHRVEVRVRMLGGGAAQPPLAQVDYSIPLGVPIGPARSTGRVTGRLFDAESGRGLEGVLVHLGGRTTVTDAHGRIVFAGVPLGTHYMQINPASIGVDRVALQDLPLQVEVQGGRTAVVEIGVVRSARVEGRVRIMEVEEQSLLISRTPGLRDAGGMGNVIIALSRDAEVHRRMSDSRGSFDFADLRPGRWTVEVIDIELPRHHRLERESFQVELVPGGETRVEFRVVPQRRELRIITEGVITAESPGAGTQPSSETPALPER